RRVARQGELADALARVQVPQAEDRIAPAARQQLLAIRRYRKRIKSPDVGVDRAQFLAGRGVENVGGLADTPQDEHLAVGREYGWAQVEELLPLGRLGVLVGHRDAGGPKPVFVEG